jgi:hypothetical protein
MSHVRVHVISENNKNGATPALGSVSKPTTTNSPWLILLPGPRSHNRWVRGLSRPNRDILGDTEPNMPKPKHKEGALRVATYIFITTIVIIFDRSHCSHSPLPQVRVHFSTNYPGYHWEGGFLYYHYYLDLTCVGSTSWRKGFQSNKPLELARHERVFLHSFQTINTVHTWLPSTMCDCRGQ